MKRYMVSVTVYETVVLVPGPGVQSEAILLVILGWST